MGYVGICEINTELNFQLSIFRKKKYLKITIFRKETEPVVVAVVVGCVVVAPEIYKKKKCNCKVHSDSILGCAMTNDMFKIDSKSYS